MLMSKPVVQAVHSGKSLEPKDGSNNGIVSTVKAETTKPQEAMRDYAKQMKIKNNAKTLRIDTNEEDHLAEVPETPAAATAAKVDA